MKALNLGCGTDIRASDDQVTWVNLDLFETGPGVIAHDLGNIPWPFERGTFDAINADDIWEHVDDWYGFMQEVHRILKPGAQVKIRTCSYGVENGFRDPDHKRWAVKETFRYWTPGHWLNTKYPHYAGDALFNEVAAFREGDNWVFALEKIPNAEDELHAMDGDDG